MPKYKAFVLWHSHSMTTTHTQIVGHLKPARREFRHDCMDTGGRVTSGTVTEKASAALPTGRRQGARAGAEALQRLKRECHFLRVVPCSGFLPEL
jgi:hypothetical protein